MVAIRLPDSTAPGRGAHRAFTLVMATATGAALTAAVPKVARPAVVAGVAAAAAAGIHRPHAVATAYQRWNHMSTVFAAACSTYVSWVLHATAAGPIRPLPPAGWQPVITAAGGGDRTADPYGALAAHRRSRGVPATWWLQTCLRVLALTSSPGDDAPEPPTDTYTLY
jgi:hypothetical protein